MSYDVDKIYLMPVYIKGPLKHLYSTPNQYVILFLLCLAFLDSWIWTTAILNFFLRMKFAVNSTHSTDECLRKYVFQLKEENEKLRKDLKVSNQAREEDKIR